MQQPLGSLVNGRYELQSIIGKGGNAIVYRALDISKRTIVAIKIIEVVGSTSDNSKCSINEIDRNGGHTSKYINNNVSGQLGDLEREVQILRSLSHANIVTYLDEFKTESKVYIVMEFAECGSLLGVLKSSVTGYFPESTATVYIREVVQGLRYLHEQGVLHRDIKAANVLVTKDNRVKLSDFGLASLAPVPFNTLKKSDKDRKGDIKGSNMEGSDVCTGDEDTSGTTGDCNTEDGFVVKERSNNNNSNNNNNNNNEGIGMGGDLVGSIYWMAPEVIRGAVVTVAADVWSLGCFTVELLTGKPPFYDRSPANALFYIAEYNNEGPPPLVCPHSNDGNSSEPNNKGFSNECIDFLKCCMKSNPADRWTTNRLLQHPWLKVDFESVGSNFANRVESSMSLSALSHGNDEKTHQQVDGDPREGFDPVRFMGDVGTDDHFGTESVCGSSTPVGQSACDSNLGSEGMLSHNTSISGYLDSILFGEACQREQWLKDGMVAMRETAAANTTLTPRSHPYLPAIVASLSTVTPEESFKIIRSLAFAAQSYAGASTLCFALGMTVFWKLDLNVIGSMDAVVIIFMMCCCYQDPAPQLYSTTVPRCSNGSNVEASNANVGITGVVVQRSSSFNSTGGLANSTVSSVASNDITTNIVKEIYPPSSQIVLKLLLRNEAVCVTCANVLHCLVVGTHKCPEDDTSVTALPTGRVGINSIPYHRTTYNNTSNLMSETSSPLVDSLANNNATPLSHFPTAVGDMTRSVGGNFLNGADALSPSTSGAMLGGKNIEKLVVKFLSSMSSSMRHAVQKRMWMDDSVQAIVEVVQDLCIAAYSSEVVPTGGWEWVEKLFEVLYTLVYYDEGVDGSNINQRNVLSATNDCFATDKWIVAIQEASNKKCPSAIALYVKLVHDIPGVVSRPATVGTFLNILVDSTIDYNLRIDVAKCFPILQSANERCKNMLMDRSSSVPLLALAIRSGIPLNEEDHITPIIVQLCESNAGMAASCASYQNFINIVIAKVHHYMGCQSANGMWNVLQLASLLFTFTETPKDFTTSQEFLKCLVTVVQEFGNIFPKDTMMLAAKILDSVGAQAYIC